MITQESRKKNRYLLVGLAIIGTAVGIMKAVQESINQDIHGDIYIFWSAGVNFLHGAALYSRIGGAEEFLYPPFAPMVFQLLALMPFPVAVGTFTIFNFVAWAAIFQLVYLILRMYFPQANLSGALTIGFLATIRYFWHNISWVNINELVALLSLSGVYQYLRGRENIGILLLTMATWMKVMPALLLVLFFVRKPLPTAWRVSLFSGLIFAGILLQRGAERGIQDYLDFWYITLIPFLRAGKVYIDAISFSIPSMVGKLLLPSYVARNYGHHHYNIANWPVHVVRQLSLLLQILTVSLTFWRVWANRNLKIPSLCDLTLVYLTMLLVAGVSWEGHFVTLALIIPATYQLLTVTNQLSLRRWMVIIVLLVGAAIYDTLGPNLYDYAQGYSLISYTAIFLYAMTLQLSWRTKLFAPPASFQFTT